MRTRQRQVIGRFVFDDTAETRNSRHRPRTFAVEPAAHSIAAIVFFLAVMASIIALSCLHL